VALGNHDEARGETWSAIVKWNDVQELAGDCLERVPDCDPVRYRTVRWPTAEVVAELRRRSTF
jgi:hypothetical protein